MTSVVARELNELHSQAKRSGRGYAVGSWPSSYTQFAAPELGWREVATRRGQGPISTLRPVTQQQAHPHSISAQVGLEQQPLHTDGAHLDRVPDIVLLISERPSSTPTRLGWTHQVAGPGTTRLWVGAAGARGQSLAGLATGVFLVHSGRRSFYSTVLGRGGIRYDPGCMSACDQRAHELAEVFREEKHELDQVAWSQQNQVLLILNRQVLHGRAAVVDGDLDRELTRIAYYSDESQS